MSYIRPFGDGPITDPRQVDETISTVPPTRVGCAQLPADSPWRMPGEVCAGAPVASSSAPNGGDNWLKDFLTGLVSGPAGPAPTPVRTDDSPPWLLLALGGAAAYYLLKKRRA